MSTWPVCAPRLVPEELYPRVLAYLGGLLAQAAPAQSPPAESLPAGGLRKTPTGRIKASSRPWQDWTPKEVAEVKANIAAHRTVVDALVGLMVATPGEAVFMTDFEHATGYSRKQLRSALAGLSQHIGKYYQRRNWPFRGNFNVNDSHEMSYVMTAEEVEIWRNA